MNWSKNNIKLALYSTILISSLFFAASLFAEEEKNQKSTYDKLKVFSEILSLIESNYVEPTQNDSMIEGAIKGMVKSLAPHTSVMPPVAYKQMQVETTGRIE